MRRIAVPSPLVSLLLPFLVVLGCDAGSSPVAPSNATLTVTANPARIGVTGTSQITVLAREMSGAAVRTGTEIRFSTTLGSIDEVARTDRDGVARAVLRADGRPGQAAVSVSSGAAMPRAAVTVAIGPSDPELTAAFSTSAQNLTVIFDDDSAGNPESWEWSFGDGAGSSARNPAHTYAAAGTYAVTLTVRNAVDEDTHSEFVTVPPEEGAP